MIASTETRCSELVYEITDAARPRAAHFGARVDDDKIGQPLGVGDREGERVDRAQGHPDENELIEPQFVDKALGVGELGGDRIVGVLRPVAVAMPALVERQAVVLVTQRQAYQIPGMGGQRAAVEKHHRRQVLPAPIEIMQSHSADLRVMPLRQHNFVKLEPGAHGRRGKVLAIFLGG